MNIDVMSFNLRYWNKADGPNAWPNRRSAVVSVIQRFAPLVMGTQEGLPEMLADLDTDLPDYRASGVAGVLMRQMSFVQYITGAMCWS